MALGIAIARREGIPPVVHGQDSTNGARVVAKEHAAEGDEATDGDGWPC